MVKKSDVVLATGRRKCAVARVRLTPGSGNVVVNGKPMAEYFTSESLCGFVNQVFTVSETVGKFDIAANFAKSKKGSKLAGIHAEGPFLCARAGKNTEMPTIEKLDLMIEHGKGLLKIITVSPEMDKQVIMNLENNTKVNIKITEINDSKIIGKVI